MADGESLDIATPRPCISASPPGVRIALLDPRWGRSDAVDREAAGLFRMSRADRLRLRHDGVTAAERDALVVAGGAIVAARRRVTLDDVVPRADGGSLRKHDLAGRPARGETLPGLAAG